MRLLKHPVLCNYYVTYRCNATCHFCDIWEKPSPYINAQDVQKNLIDLKKLGVKVIDFTGGEPLLHREIDVLLSLAKKQGFITTLTTNGLLYPKWAKRIRGKVDMLHFSLDASTAEKHDSMRGIPCFDKLMESIKIAQSLGERPDILFTVFGHNLGEVRLVYDTICLPNKLVMILNPAFSYNRVETGENLKADQLAELQLLGKEKYIYLNQAFIQLRLDGGNRVDSPVCRAASSTIVVSPENKLVLPCYHLGIKEFDINGDLYDLYRSTEVRMLVEQEGRLPNCEGCTINCYMQPSFAVETGKYWRLALPSTLKYNYLKGTWKKLLPGEFWK